MVVEVLVVGVVASASAQVATSRLVRPGAGGSRDAGWHDRPELIDERGHLLVGQGT
jgi:hypothetical protein